MIVLAESRETDDEVLARLRQRIVEVTIDIMEMPPDDVVLAPPHTVLKTSSGKLRRAASRELYESGRIGAKPRALWWRFARLAVTGLLRRPRQWMGGPGRG